MENVEVTLFNKPFTLRTDNAKRIMAVAEYVNQKINQVIESTNLNPHSATLLALLMVGEELFQEKIKVGELKKAIVENADIILKALNKGVGDNPPGGGMGI